MRLPVTLFLLLLGSVAGAQEHADTLVASKVSSVSGCIVVPQRIGSRELRSVTNLPEAIRRFAGVQVRDYGGVGGLKTINVRSLGSEHTGVFVDGIQVDNAQNMQVDLGRFGLEGLEAVSLFSGQKTAPLQAAKEYSSSSALYLESAAPVFKGGKDDNFLVRIGGGSFGTVSPKASWEHLFKDGTSLRISGEAVSSNGEYRFHVKDYHQYPDGSLAGYDTTMVRKNCDLASVLTEARLYGPSSGNSSWNIHAYFYGSGRGLPGPVYKKAGEYPLSKDRQTDRDAFLQGRYMRQVGDIWSFAVRSKLSFSHLEYSDFPELVPGGQPARYNYRNHSAYTSATASAKLGGLLRMDVAQDLQYDYLDSDMRDFAYPGRLSSWSSFTTLLRSSKLDASATLLYLGVRDSFIAGSSRSTAFRGVWMPSMVARWKLSQRMTVTGMAKRSYRMPTFNDLYYTIVGTKTLDPEDAMQFDLGAEWITLEAGANRLSMKVDIYRNILKNKIIAVPTSNQFRWSMYNLGKVAVLGSDVTLDYSGKFGDAGAGVTARYTFQRSRDRSDPESLTWNGQIPYIPEHSGSVNVSGLLRRWRADITFFATGERYSTSANLPPYRLEPWFTLDASVSRSFTLGQGILDLRLKLNNLLNEQYEIIDNYPMPGFNLMLTTIYNF